ncbi:MAG TPA: hypothetical protein VGS11_11115 [Candidatus Bathyarchaeia archaeon]|nr:hypothetical protein [Candidatus Bathyarchaeia archaeon]
MTQLLTLRKAVSKKLGISIRQLRNRVRDKAAEEGILDRDVALLLIASRIAKIDIRQPRFKVPEDKISTLNEHLRSRGQAIVQVPQGAGRRVAKEAPVRMHRLLTFHDKFPIPIFYNRLEDEINLAFNNPGLPNAVLVLSRKLIENLVYNLLEYRFKGPGIDIYYNRLQMRAHDFSVLLDNLKKYRSEFEPNHQELIDQFLKIISETNFRREANSKAHKVMEYLGSMRDISKLKIPDMVQILLLLIGRVTEPKWLNVTKASQLDNGLLINVMNAGNSSARLTDYTVEGLPKKSLGKEVIVQPGVTATLALPVPDEFKFQPGKPVQFGLWLDGETELRFQHAVRIRRSPVTNLKNPDSDPDNIG